MGSGRRRSAAAAGMAATLSMIAEKRTRLITHLPPRKPRRRHNVRSSRWVPLRLSPRASGLWTPVVPPHALSRWRMSFSGQALESIVEAEPQDVRLEAVACAGEQIGLGREIDVEVLGLGRPVRCQPDLEAGASSPTEMRVGLR